jgi:protein TonB
MSAALPAAPRPDPESAGRLAIGILASALVHLALLVGFAPATPRFTQPTPLQVEIRRAPDAEPSGEIAIPQPSELAGPPAELAPPREPAPQPAPTAAGPEALIEASLPLDRYYGPREVDVRAEPLNEVDLVYPQVAYQNRTRGRVRLNIFINQDGAIDRVEVVEAIPPGIFEEAALTATNALRFSPATKWGRPVKSRKAIEVVFDPYESINTP